MADKQWRSYLLFRKKAKWKPWRSFVKRQRTGWVADVGAAGQTDVMETIQRQEVSGQSVCVCVFVLWTRLCCLQHSFFTVQEVIQKNWTPANQRWFIKHINTLKSLWEAQTNPIVSLISFAANQSSTVESKVEWGRTRRTEPNTTNVILHLFLLSAEFFSFSLATIISLVSHFYCAAWSSNTWAAFSSLGEKWSIWTSCRWRKNTNRAITGHKARGRHSNGR